MTRLKTNKNDGTAGTSYGCLPCFCIYTAKMYKTNIFLHKN